MKSERDNTMKRREIYQKPEIEIVVFPDGLMLELPVNSTTEVDDEAAKQNLDDEDLVNDTNIDWWK